MLIISTYAFGGCGRVTFECMDEKGKNLGCECKFIRKVCVCIRVGTGSLVLHFMFKIKRRATMLS